MIFPPICEVPSITITWIDPQGVSRPLSELPYLVREDGLTDEEHSMVFYQSGTFIPPNGVHKIYVKTISDAHIGGD